MNFTRLKETAFLFLKLGAISFGGPAAHNALMEYEIVTKRKWITREHFLDLLGIANIIPGPISTQMAIFIGYAHAGWLGLIIAGICFIIPAAIITLLFAYLYSIYGNLSQFNPIIGAIRAGVISIIISVVFRLGKAIFNKKYTIAILGAVAIFSFLKINALILLLAAGVCGLIWENRANILNKFTSSSSKINNFIIGFFFAGIQSNSSKVVPSLSNIFLYFLKVGSVIFGGGYVLFSFIKGDLVDSMHWLTNDQLLDAIAIGQFTPGPILSTATFIGYLISGIPGAIFATIGIFFPSFILVAITNPLISKIRKTKALNGFLSGVNAGALGLIVTITILLAQSSLINPEYVIIFLLSLFIIFFKKVNPAWIILGSGLVGFIISLTGVNF